jgi:hypothetical protein
MLAFLQRIKKNRNARVLIYSIIGIYALIGFFLTTVFFAIKLHLTNDPGAVDFNDRRFTEITNQTDSLKGESSNSGIDGSEEMVFYKINVLRQFYPGNADWILNAFIKTRDVKMAGKMFEALDLYLADNASYKAKIAAANAFLRRNDVIKSDSNVYQWANSEEWHIFRQAVVKDKRIIDSVALATGTESRLLTAMLVGEQIRLFDSRREAFKKWVAPLKILVNETTLSLGVMGIKEETARKIENYLKDKTSVFYLGPAFENMLDFKTSDPDKERFQRLTNSRNHTYPYLYCALYLCQVRQQWSRSGYNISKRPEILATLFNLGFPVSVPKPNPRVGGSRINIMGKVYTFGGLAYEYYYSGELHDAYPYNYPGKPW